MRVAAAARESRRRVEALTPELEARREPVYRRVHEAFSRVGLTEPDLAPTTGYGYGARGREKLDALFASVLGGEAALVRSQIVSGTHAIRLGLLAALAPGDEVVVLTGPPYETLLPLFDPVPVPGNLAHRGIRARIVDHFAEPPRDVAQWLSPRTRLVFLQRSAGYSQRASLGERELRPVLQRLAALGVATLVDNCYGELVEPEEPLHWGASLVAGSLIKNLGAALPVTGGYLAGRRELVERAGAELTAPGLGGAVGASPQGIRLEAQGLYQSPAAVGEMLRTAMYAASLFELLGFAVRPRFDAARTDVIQCVTLGSRDALVAACRALQAASPVDANLVPEPAIMPGYAHEIVMAAGTFVQGATSELSADGVAAPPHELFIQGGTSHVMARLSLDRMAQTLEDLGLTPGR